MRNNSVIITNADPLQSIRCALLPPSLSSTSLMNSAESALAALGSIINARSSANSSNNNSGNTNPTPNNKADQQDEAGSKMLHWLVKPGSNNGVLPPGGGGKTPSRSSGQHKMLLAQIARLQTELQMQAVRHQSTIAELRRRLAYISARQLHTPMAVERTHLIRLPLNNTGNNSPSEINNDPTELTMTRKFGFSVLPDGTGLGGAIVTSVVNESLAFTAGLHIFDRICKIDGVDICNSSTVTFSQLVELLKGSPFPLGNRQFLTLEIARFEEPPNKIFGCGEENGHEIVSPSYSPNSSKENDEQYSPSLLHSSSGGSSSCQCEHNNHQTNKITVASVAVQTLPCLNPWFLADIRTNSTASRTLRNGQQLQEKKQSIPENSISVQTSSEISNQSIAKAGLIVVTQNQNRVAEQPPAPAPVVVTSKPPAVTNTVLLPSTPAHISCPTIGISNFVPPASLNIIPAPKQLPPSETDEKASNKKWPTRSASDDSAISMETNSHHNIVSNTIEEPSITTLSSEKTWRTSSSSTTISLPNSQSAGNSSSRSFSSGKKQALSSSPSVESSNSSQQQTPDKQPQQPAMTVVENFQRPITMYTNSQHLAHTIRIQQHLFLQAQQTSSKAAKLSHDDAGGEQQPGCFDEEDEEEQEQVLHLGDESQQKNAVNNNNDTSLHQPDEEQSKRRLSSLSYVSCTSSPIATTPMTSSNRTGNHHGEPADDVLSWNDGSSNGGKGRDTSSADACRDYRWVVKVKSDGTRRIVKRPVNKNSETPSSCNTSTNNDYEEKVSNNSTPADESAFSHHRHHHHHHRKQHSGAGGSHRRHRHQHEKSSEEPDAEMSPDEQKTSRQDNKPDHHTPKVHSSSKRRPDPVLAVTTV